MKIEEKCIICQWRYGIEDGTRCMVTGRIINNQEDCPMGDIEEYIDYCAFCVHFEPVHRRETFEHDLWVDDTGYCTRFPPSYVGNDEGGGSCWDQPEVNGSGSCGEHKVNKETVKRLREGESK